VRGDIIARVYAQLHDRDRAFAWLDTAFVERSGPLPELSWVFLFDSLRDDPRWAVLIRKINFK
jgi:hypothetical protein